MFPSFKAIVFTCSMALWVSRATSAENPNICSVVQGLPGLNGRDGRDGANGLKGDPGPSGQTGAQGATGSIGPPGKIGPTGQKGIQGDKGVNGIEGLKGEKGSAGSAGIPGTNGATGNNGSPGIQGVKGTAGAMGPKGEPGVKGEKGSTGSNGIPGAKGANGVPGSAGISGSPGAKGEKGVPDSSMTTNVAKLEKSLAALETRLASLQKALVFTNGMSSGNKIYKTNGQETTYDEGKAICSNAGGQMASPRNAQENQAVLTMSVQNNKKPFLGINDIQTEGTFRYPNGEVISYSNWSRGQPDNYEGAEDCVEMYDTGMWNDHVCSEKRLIICEFF